MRFRNRFGECKVICHLKDVAIVELENNYEKYVVTLGLSIKTGSWQRGFYCKNLKEASEVFNKIIEEFYMAVFKI